MMVAMQLPTSHLARALVCASLGAAGCSSTIAGQDFQASEADAGVRDVAAPDAGGGLPVPDAAPQVAPCVEGDVQLSAPDQSCYMYFSTQLTSTQAQAACLGLGATLAIVLDADTQAIVAGLAGNATAANPDVWLGASDELVENSFVWVDGTPMIFNQWRLGEPNNGNGGTIENCTIIEGDNPAREWDDRPCANVHPYICLRAPGA